MDCPAPGCDYQSPKEEAVKGHWGGRQDEDHTGAYHKAREAYDESSQGQTRARESGESGSDGDTVEFPESPDGGDTDPPDAPADGETELPCGHESFDEDSAPAYPFTVTCDTCGNSWTVSE